ncbi:MAG TPA: energy-coupled thiamine transporter ThiT [Firmicutes bacterium]|nr:energy-coupled thiamine transporter ThiT [Bacillota bacterium]
MQNKNIRKISISAVLLALGFVLSFIKIPMFTGGSITFFSMVPIVLLAYMYGTPWGLLCGGIHGLLQIIEGGLDAPPVPSAFNYFLVFMLDYLLAWALVGLAGLFRKISKNPAVCLGVGGIVGVFGRFICSTLSGILIWSVYYPEWAPGIGMLIGSAGANLLTLGPEMVITAVGACIIGCIPYLKKIMEKERV